MKTMIKMGSFAALMAHAANPPAALTGRPRMDMDAGAVDKLLKEIKSDLNKVNDEVRKTAEQALSETKKNGALTEETKQAADKALTVFNGFSTTITKLEGKLEALETRNLDLEQVVAQGGGRGGAAAPKSMGKLLVENAQLKNWLSGGMSGALAIQVANAITTVGGATDGLIAPHREAEIVGMARRTLRVRDLLNVTTTESDVIHFAKQITRTNNAAPTAETGTMPVSVYAWDQAEANVRKISTTISISDEALADAGQLMGMVDGELRYDLDQEEEDQIIAGAGTGQNLSGLITNATAFSAAAGLPNATAIDRLRLGLLQLALANYSATGIMLNPVNWAGIELLKDTQGRYIFGDPSKAGTPRLWGADVVETTSLSAGEWLAGNVFIAATLYDRQQTEVLISSEHADNFVEGMKTMRATKRLALANKRGSAMVKGNFTFA